MAKSDVKNRYFRFEPEGKNFLTYFQALVVKLLRKRIKPKKAQKAASWGTIMSWRNRFSKTQEALQAEIDARDKQLRDIAASLILLESQLQKVSFLIIFRYYTLNII